jgi:hypothetical protein
MVDAMVADRRRTIAWAAWVVLALALCAPSLRLLGPVLGPVGPRMERRIWTAARDCLKASGEA